MFNCLMLRKEFQKQDKRLQADQPMRLPFRVSILRFPLLALLFSLMLYLTACATPGPARAS